MFCHVQRVLILSFFSSHLARILSCYDFRSALRRIVTSRDIEPGCAVILESDDDMIRRRNADNRMVTFKGSLPPNWLLVRGLVGAKRQVPYPLSASNFRTSTSLLAGGS